MPNSQIIGSIESDYEMQKTSTRSTAKHTWVYDFHKPNALSNQEQQNEHVSLTYLATLDAHVSDPNTANVDVQPMWYERLQADGTDNVFTTEQHASPSCTLGKSVYYQFARLDTRCKTVHLNPMIANYGKRRAKLTPLQEIASKLEEEEEEKRTEELAKKNAAQQKKKFMLADKEDKDPVTKSS